MSLYFPAARLRPASPIGFFHRAGCGDNIRLNLWFGTMVKRVETGDIPHRASPVQAFVPRPAMYAAFCCPMHSRRSGCNRQGLIGRHLAKQERFTMSALDEITCVSKARRGGSTTASCSSTFSAAFNHPASWKSMSESVRSSQSWCVVSSAQMKRQDGRPCLTSDRTRFAEPFSRYGLRRTLAQAHNAYS